MHQPNQEINDMSEIKVSKIKGKTGVNGGKPNIASSFTIGGLSLDSAYGATGEGTILNRGIINSNTLPDSAEVERGNFWYNDSGATPTLSMLVDPAENRWVTLNGTEWSGLSGGGGWYGDRAVIGGGYTTTSQYNENGIDYKSITVSSATATDFGDLTVARVGVFSGSDGTTGVFYGGYAQGVTNRDTMDYVTIATPANATDWGGTLSAGSREGGSYCDGSYHVTGGAIYNNDNNNANRIDYFTTTTGSSSSQFGTLTVTAYHRACANDATRGLFGGGSFWDGSTNTYQNTIDYITTATTGNATDFGDLTYGRTNLTGTSSTTTAFWMGGTTNSTNHELVIDYVTIQTTANAADWGDLSLSIRSAGATSDGVDYALCCGGSASWGSTERIGRFSMTTSGNAADFGDLVRDRTSNPAGSTSGD